MISSKGSFTRNHWTFNLFNTFSLTSRAFRKTGILLKHTNAENNSICVMRIMSPEEEKDALASAQIVDRVALNWIKQVDPKTTVGVEVLC